MFLRKLAIAVGRLDFWNLPKEMTRFQLAVHRAAMDLDSVGEDRADMRSAIQTILTVQSNAGKALTAEQIETLWKSLTKYTPLHASDDPSQITIDEAAAQMKSAFARIGK